jgi:hypothetical protein
MYRARCEKTRKQHREDTSKKDAIERSGAADGMRQAHQGRAPSSDDEETNPNVQAHHRRAQGQ